MKLQYLGDSKDSFKWDYHDYLTSELKYPELNIALMLTPDDARGHGRTKAEWFPAKAPVLNFCRDLRSTRDVERIKNLPQYTGATYQVTLHNGASRLISRAEYFSGFKPSRDQIVFVDPDNGFEPERSCGEKHVSYHDVARILGQLNENSIVTVFHPFRRVSFPDDFALIRARLGSGHSTAIYWHSLMFVAVASSAPVIGTVIEANRRYAKTHLVKTIV